MVLNYTYEIRKGGEERMEGERGKGRCAGTCVLTIIWFLIYFVSRLKIVHLQDWWIFQCVRFAV